ncbi:MAG TPA: rhamnulokinase family protein [Verrucomicrobiota bacterium]|nr:rhamnulokinase family protein [Verrucomicrobiota bacterium]HNU51948.1 rhamnulokinase family protein [Verrucomicrobiota bacterium]
MSTCHLACDLGAESGRLILGSLEEGRLSLEEIHRFPNGPVAAGDSLHWDMARLRGELKAGLRVVAGRGLTISSISTDSWGVDYVLYDAEGREMEPAFHYRDERCGRGVERVKARVSWPEMFAETGLQFLPFNTVFQLAAEAPERLAQAALVLGIGDAFNHWLSGVARFEESLASTTQLYNPRSKGWSTALCQRLGLPMGILPPIVPSGTRLGPMRPGLVTETGLGGVEVVASCSHDTGAAVAAVPASGDCWAYLSSGTWSLMGVEQSEPVLTDRCRELNFTNEVGYGSSVRLLKNIIGLWLLQECRREWAREGASYDYDTLTRLAAEAPPFVSLIDPTDPRFLSPGGMSTKIAAACRELGQPVPGDAGAYARAILESLALLYRRTLGQMETLIGRRIERLHIVGGGSKNALLNQFAANALQIPVVTGPVEATAAGNILVQALAMGELGTLAAAREVVRASFETSVFHPTDGDAWAEAGARFEKLVGERRHPV